MRQAGEQPSRRSRGASLQETDDRIVQRGGGPRSVRSGLEAVLDAIPEPLVLLLGGGCAKRKHLRGHAMGRASLKIFLLLLFLCHAALPVLAEEKIRLAVMDFDADALQISWSYGWPQTDLGTAAADNLAAELSQGGKFSVIEREKLNLVLEEHRLFFSGFGEVPSRSKWVSC